MIDIPSNLTDGDSVYLGDKRFVYNDGKLVPYVVTNVGTELTSPKLNVETLTEFRHPVSGKPIYTKTINFGALPSNSTKTLNVDFNMAEDIWVDMSRTYAYRKDVNISIPLSNNIFISNFYLTKTAISISTLRTDANTYENTYITVLYTKTADTSSSPVKSLYTGSLNGSLNEIRQNVETLAGYKRNGKDVYQMEVDCGALPNTTAKIVTIPNYNASYAYWLSSGSYAFNSSSYTRIPLPAGAPNAGTDYNIAIYTAGNSIIIVTYTNQSVYTETKVVLHYTK